VNDTPANLHILIGTNLTGLQGYLHEAIVDFASRKNLVGEHTVITSQADCQKSLENKIRNLCRQLKITIISKESLIRKLAIMLNQSVDNDEVVSLAARLLENDDISIRKQVNSLNIDKELAEDISRQLERDLQDLHCVRYCIDTIVDLLKQSHEQSVHARLNETYRDMIIKLLKNRFLVLKNPFISGDHIMLTVARNIPPNYSGKIMGMQNIKGTGLDFAYRWVSLANIQAAITRLDDDNNEVRRKGLDYLLEYDDYGIMDAPLAITALKTYRKKAVREFPEIIPQLDECIGRIQRDLDISHTQIKSETRYRNLRSIFLWILEQLREAGDSKRRKRQVNQVMTDLFNQRISHVKAKKVLHEIKSRQDGGWLKS
jgi:hypothetical protein